MDKKNFQLYTSIIAIASIAILMTMIPQSYGQANVSQQQQGEQVLQIVSNGQIFTKTL